jgi:hypothetical protein
MRGTRCPHQLHQKEAGFGKKRRKVKKISERKTLNFKKYFKTNLEIGKCNQKLIAINVSVSISIVTHECLSKGGELLLCAVCTLLNNIIEVIFVSTVAGGQACNTGSCDGGTANDISSKHDSKLTLKEEEDGEQEVIVGVSRQIVMGYEDTFFFSDEMNSQPPERFLFVENVLARLKVSAIIFAFTY